jgi:hypothetical protein
MFSKETPEELKNILIFNQDPTMFILSEVLLLVDPSLETISLY